jgi:ABC-type phosphate/phosphonate transport system substrate-binding protein
VQVIAANGQSRWYGCIRAYINAELRMVIVGTNSRDEVRAKWEIVPEDLR